MDKGSNASGITTTGGLVNATLLNYYNHSLLPEALQGNIHTLGELTPTWNICPYTLDESITGADQDCNFFANDNGLEYAYRFLEYNPNDTASAYPYRTKRIIKASTGLCYQFKDPDITSVDSPDGKQATWSYSFFNIL